MNRFSAWIVYSNIWVGMSCTSLYLLHLAPQDKPVELYAAFLLCCTVAAYNYMRIAQPHGQLAFALSGYKAWVLRNQLLVKVLGFTFALGAGFFLAQFFTLKALWLLLPPVVVSLLYPISLGVESNHSFSLRSFPGMKLLLISSTWAYMAVLLPQCLFGHWHALILLDFFQVMLLTAALTIPFDIRDLEADDPAMQTLPYLLGANKALLVSRFLLFSCQILALLQCFLGWQSLAWSLGYLLALEFGQLLLRKKPQEKGEFYTAFWIESIPILAYLSIWMIYRLS